MSSRKGIEVLTSGESQKQTSITPKTKQKRVSNASDSSPGPINLTKKIIKKNTAPLKTSKSEQKTVKTSKIIKKNEKESEDSDEKKDLAKKTTKQKLKEKLITKTSKKTAKEVKKNKNLALGNNEKVEKLQKPKKPVKKSEDKDEKKPTEKVQKEKKVKEVKKKPISKPVKKNIEEVEPVKTRVDVKPEKKEKPKKAKVIGKNKIKINSSKGIDDNTPMECLDVVKDEGPDDVPLLQVFQLQNGPVCNFDGNVCNTITISQDNTCIKIKEISVSQLPYSVITEENKKIDVTTAVKKESKQSTDKQTTEKQKAEKQKIDKQKPEKLKVEKQKSEKQQKEEKQKTEEKLKTEKQKTEKQKIDKQKSVKSKSEKQKIEKPKAVKSVVKPVKVEKKKKPAVVEKIKPKATPKKVTPKAKTKGRPVSKRPRVASLNAIAKVHCLYENESKSALIDAMNASAVTTPVVPVSKVKKNTDAEASIRKGKRTSKRTTPGLKSVGRHWDMHDTSSTNSSSSGNFILIS